MTLHIRQLAGKNSHHIIEATFKAFARALRQATEYDPRRRGTVPSITEDTDTQRGCCPVPKALEEQTPITNHGLVLQMSLNASIMEAIGRSYRSDKETCIRCMC
ncbi:imidazoleglycerol-phosphate dehydratase [Tanacetum coccineum]